MFPRLLNQSVHYGLGCVHQYQPTQQVEYWTLDIVRSFMWTLLQHLHTKTAPFQTVRDFWMKHLRTNEASELLWIMIKLLIYHGNNKQLFIYYLILKIPNVCVCVCVCVKKIFWSNCAALGAVSVAQKCRF